jgi:hypothetical protein
MIRKCAARRMWGYMSSAPWQLSGLNLQYAFEFTFVTRVGGGPHRTGEVSNEVLSSADLKGYEITFASLLSDIQLPRFRLASSTAAFAEEPIPHTSSAIVSVQDDGHHEVGTLWMGAPGHSVTDYFGSFHNTANVYVACPALFRVSQSISYRNTFGGRTAVFSSRKSDRCSEHNVQTAFQRVTPWLPRCQAGVTF